jgi:DNA-binding CsgD family transcriptional regulator
MRLTRLQKSNRLYASDLILMFEEKAAYFPLRALIRLGPTQCESEILSWVAQGKTNPEIGTILGISLRTVQKHLERVYGRLGVENRHAAMALVHEALHHERDAR